MSLVKRWTLDRGDALQLAEAESFTIADIGGVVIRQISYEVSVFGGLCNRHVMPSDPAGRWGETGLESSGLQDPLNTGEP